MRRLGTLLLALAFTLGMVSVTYAAPSPGQADDGNKKKKRGKHKRPPKKRKDQDK